MLNIFMTISGLSPNRISALIRISQSSGGREGREGQGGGGGVGEGRSYCSYGLPDGCVTLCDDAV